MTPRTAHLWHGGVVLTFAFGVVELGIQMEAGGESAGQLLGRSIPQHESNQHGFTG